MSSTNKTANYDLSQFLGTDKPAWLADYNQDMSKIDSAIKGVADDNTLTDGKADANAAAIGNIASLQTTDKTNLVAAVNEVNTDAETAQALANSASSTANAANTKATAVESAFNIDTFADLTMSVDKGSLTADSFFKIARNNDGSIAKIYGQANVQNIALNTNVTLTLGNTGLLPTAAFSINPAGIRVYLRTNGTSDVQTVPATFNVNGTITITFPTSTDCSQQRIIFMPTVTFVKDFGD